MKIEPNELEQHIGETLYFARSERRDGCGAEDYYFSTLEEAEIMAVSEYDHLTRREKEKYHVTLCAGTVEGDEEYASIDNWAWVKDYDEVTEAELIADDIKHSAEWDQKLCERLCKLAGLEEEWKAADGKTFESVVYKAADVMRVII